jgi:hypothetical protein
LGWEKAIGQFFSREARVLTFEDTSPTLVCFHLAVNKFDFKLVVEGASMNRAIRFLPILAVIRNAGQEVFPFKIHLSIIGGYSAKIHCPQTFVVNKDENIIKIRVWT